MDIKLETAMGLRGEWGVEEMTYILGANEFCSTTE